MILPKKKAMKILRIMPLFILLLLASTYIYAIPSQPQVSYVSNTTSASAGIGQARSDDKGGYITTINLNATQQNYAWKAYVGNVTGQLVLEDNNQNSIYSWDMQLNTNGNVYIARNGTVDWNTLNCSNRTIIEAEDVLLKINGTSKSINQTFNGTTHKSFLASGKNFGASICPAIATYKSDAPQTNGETNEFQEIILNDNSANLIYMTIMEQDKAGFDANSYDFQAIVAEDETLPTPFTYYFYLELL